MLGPSFGDELALVSRLWFACGYRPGIAAYLNFFLLREFNATHDAVYPARFATFRSMARSFYQTDLFIREVTDSGRTPSGGISNPAVRATLKDIMRRHRLLMIPPWMMSYFGFNLLENVERQCQPLSVAEQCLHLAYMCKAFRIMGVAFSQDRELLERFARLVEREHAGISETSARHVRHILALGEMVGVSSKLQSIDAMLPQHTRSVFAQMYRRVRPSAAVRTGARMLGRVLMKRAVGQPRRAIAFHPASTERR